MRTLSRLIALTLGLLLLAQAGWAMPECDGGGSRAPGQSTHHTMPAGQHEHMPAPTDHHGSCQLALCAMSSGCARTALLSSAARITPDAMTSQGTTALLATSSPVGPAAPEPPPPRA